ncbi:MAG: hypothetical protein R3E01_02880 [Pirellulaceae bacterium]
MSDHPESSHWEQIAAELGADAPGELPRRGSEGKAEAVPPAVPPKPAKAKASATPPPARSHWQSLAGFLGLSSPVEPEPEPEPAVSTATDVDAVSSHGADGGAEKPFPELPRVAETGSVPGRERKVVAEPDIGWSVPKQDAGVEADQVEFRRRSEATPAEVTAEDLFDDVQRGDVQRLPTADDLFDRWDEDLFDTGEASARRVLNDMFSAPPTVFEEADTASDVKDQYSDLDDELDEETSTIQGEAEAGEKAGRGRRRRGRRGRRRRGGRPEGAEAKATPEDVVNSPGTGEPDELLDIAPFDRELSLWEEDPGDIAGDQRDTAARPAPVAAGARHEGSSGKMASDADFDDDDDDGDDDDDQRSSGRRGRRPQRFTSWKDAIDVIVDRNIESHRKSGPSHGGGGGNRRRRGGRRR